MSIQLSVSKNNYECAIIYILLCIRKELESGKTSVNWRQNYDDKKQKSDKKSERKKSKEKKEDKKRGREKEVGDHKCLIIVCEVVYCIIPIYFSKEGREKERKVNN